MKTVTEKLVSLLTETATLGHLLKSLAGPGFVMTVSSFCKEKRHQGTPKQILEEMQGVEALPLLDYQHAHSLLKGDDGLHIYKDVMEMSFETTVMAMTTELRSLVVLGWCLHNSASSVGRSAGRSETTAEKDKGNKSTRLSFFPWSIWTTNLAWLKT